MKTLIISLLFFTTIPAMAQDLTYSQYRSNTVCTREGMTQEECAFYVKISNALDRTQSSSKDVSNELRELKREIEQLERKIETIERKTR